MKDKRPVRFLDAQTRKQQIVDMLLTDVNTFRQEAKSICKQFDNTKRKLFSYLNKITEDSQDSLTYYLENVYPSLSLIEKKINNKSFINLISKNLLLTDQQANELMISLVNTRLSDIKNNYINQIILENSFPKSYAKKISEIINLPFGELNQLNDLHIDFLLFNEIANENNVTIYDPYSPLSTRLNSMFHIKLENSKVEHLRCKRLKSVEKRISEINSMGNGIVSEIIKSNLELMEIIALRNLFDKKLRLLPEKDRCNSIKRLKIFDDVALDYKNKVLSNISYNTSQNDLSITREKVKQIDSLLLHIFDLSNMQKNQLVLLVREYKDLIAEKNELLNGCY